MLDDDSESAALVEKTVRAAGHAVVTMSDPMMAGQLVRQEGVDLLLVDLSIGALEIVPRWERRKTDPEPGAGPLMAGEGYAVLRPLDGEPDVARYPAVFLKGGQPFGDPREARRFGVVSCLSKPVSLRTLRCRLQNFFQGPLPNPTAPLLAPAPHAADLDGEVSLSLEGDLYSGWGVTTPPFESLPSVLRKALLMDRDEQFRTRLRGILEFYGFSVSESSQPEEALRLALEKRPWLILTDVNPPGGEGFEFCRWVRSHSLISHTPLIFLSMWDGHQERHHGLKLGADEYLSKRESIRETLVRIELILNRYSDLQRRTRNGAGLEGHIELVAAPGVLQMCHVSQLSGVLTGRYRLRTLEIGFHQGQIISARSGSLRGVEAVYEFLSWEAGHFEFVPRDVGRGAPLDTSFERLLLEGCRRLDEKLYEDTNDPAAPAARSATESKVAGPGPRDDSSTDEASYH